MAVICRGPAFTLKLPPGVGGGVGSTAPLKILAGLNLVCEPLKRDLITDNDQHTINILESGIVEGVGLAPLVVAVGGGGGM